MGYLFHKTQDQEGRWQLELDGIRLVVEGFEERDGQHWLQAPHRAVAFFNVNGNFYGIANNLVTHPTAEALYEDLHQQYCYFQPKEPQVPVLA